MKKYSELSKTLVKPTRESYSNYDRESFIKGDLLKVGDIVEHNGKRAEVINIGSNYATLIREGKTFKSWITEIKVVNSKSIANEPIAIDENVSYKGYKTKNFTTELSEKFINIFDEGTDHYAYYNCVVACDSLLGATPTALIEFFHKYKNDFERVSRYTQKFGIDVPKLVNIGEAIEMIKEYNRGN